jgi:hypothetical protein
VYANDSPGNAGSSETLTFTIAEPEPFLTAYVAAVSVGSAAVVVAGLLVYFKRSNQRTKEA